MKKLFFTIVMMGVLFFQQIFATELDSVSKQKVEVVFSMITDKYKDSLITTLKMLVVILDTYKPQIIDPQKLSILEYLLVLAEQKVSSLTHTLGSTENTISNVDMVRVKQQRMDRYSAERATLGLTPYQYDSRLDATTLERSEYSKSIGSISHKRSPGDSYYDYNKIMQWFADRGVTFSVVNSTTYTENIGRGVYRCSENDCTEKFISAIKTTFDFFMSEKYKSYKPHYNSIINKNFAVIGLGIAVDQSAGKYYLTVHYATEVK